MHKNCSIKIIIVLFIGLVFTYNKAESSVGIGEFDGFVYEADLIVEGAVVDQQESAAHDINGYVGQSDAQVIFEFGFSKVALFEVHKTYKGRIKPLEHIKIYPEYSVAEQTNVLSVNKKYVLFLKRHKFKDGYVVMNQGRSEWIVFDYEGSKKVKSWYQLPQYRPKDAYQDYDAFIGRIMTKLSQISVDE